ncbi:MAG: rhlE, partial [Chitinophagaceae bacterium]|nr:rhlE [Chitinophagaceae bacterium]
IPNISETYVHRIGRSGRAGAKGTSFSFCDAEEKEFLRDIEKLIGKKIPVFEDHPFPMTNERPELKAQTQHSLRPKQSKPSSSSRNKSKGSTGNSSRPSSGEGQGSSARPASSNSGNSSRPASGGSGNSSRPASKGSGNSARPSSNAPKKKWPGAGHDPNDNRNY